MAYAINEKEFNEVLALDSSKRFDHFVGRVVDWEQAWGVKNDEGWLVPIAPEGFEYFPIWPHPEYAQKITDEKFPNHSATEITLEEIFEHWLPLLEKDKVKIAVFPDMEWTFWCIEPSDLKEELENELAKYG